MYAESNENLGYEKESKATKNKTFPEWIFWNNFWGANVIIIYYFFPNLYLTFMDGYYQSHKVKYHIKYIVWYHLTPMLSFCWLLRYKPNKM